MKEWTCNLCTVEFVIGGVRGTRTVTGFREKVCAMYTNGATMPLLSVFVDIIVHHMPADSYRRF